MANSNSIELHPSLPFSADLPATPLFIQHEKKSCSLSSLSSDRLLQLNGLAVQLLVNFPFDHVITGKVLAVLIHADQNMPSEVLFLEHGFPDPDFLDSKHTFLIEILGQ
jgi:hypothetical protein